LIPEKHAYRGNFDRSASLFFQERYVDSNSEVRCKLLNRRLPVYKDLRVIMARAQYWVYRTFIAISEKHLSDIWMSSASDITEEEKLIVKLFMKVLYLLYDTR